MKKLPLALLAWLSLCCAVHAQVPGGGSPMTPTAAPAFPTASAVIAGTQAYTGGGVITALGSIVGGSGYAVGSHVLSVGTLAGGTGYVTGVYANVPITGGSGAGLTATITVNSSGAVAIVAVNTSSGTGYLSTDTGLSASNTNLGNSGSGLTFNVASVGYVNVPLTGGSGASAAANITVNAGGAVSAVALQNRGNLYTASDTLSATPANIGGGSGFSVAVSKVGTVSAPANSWLWQSSASASDNPGSNPVSGVCADATFCANNLFVVGRDTVDASFAANGYYAYMFTDNYGGTGAAGAHHTALFQFTMAATPTADTAGTNYTALNAWTAVNAPPQFASSFFGENIQCKLSSAASSNISQCVGLEIDVNASIGSVANQLIGEQVVQQIAGGPSGSLFNAAYSANNISGAVGWDYLFVDGAYSGFPSLKSTGTWGGCFPHAGSGDCGTIANGLDFNNYAAISNFILRGPQANGSIDGAFNVTANTIAATSTGSASAPDFVLSHCGSGCGWYAPASSQVALSVGGSAVLDYGITVAAQWATSVTFRAGAFNIAGNTNLTAPATRTLQIGPANSGAAGAQTLQVQSGSGSNIAGANWTIIGSLSTGTATDGDIVFQTGVKNGASGTGVATATNALVIKGETQSLQLPAVTTGTPAASLCIDASNNIIKKTTTGSCI